MGLYPATSGQVLYYGNGKETDLTELSPKEMRCLRKELQIIFQDPYSSLNPRMTVGQLIEEGVATHKFYRKGSPQMQEYVTEIMEKCHEKGVATNAWTVNNPDMARKLIDWGIDFITTNILE